MSPRVSSPGRRAGIGASPNCAASFAVGGADAIRRRPSPGRFLLRWAGIVVAALLLALWGGTTFWEATLYAGGVTLRSFMGRISVCDRPERSGRLVTAWIRYDNSPDQELTGGWRQRFGLELPQWLHRWPHAWEVFVPYWCLIAPITVLTALQWWPRAPAKGPGHCGNCGYDLTGNASGRCSECGAPVPDR